MCIFSGVSPAQMHIIDHSKASSDCVIELHHETVITYNSVSFTDETVTLATESEGVYDFKLECRKSLKQLEYLVRNVSE